MPCIQVHPEKYLDSWRSDPLRFGNSKTFTNIFAHVNPHKSNNYHLLIRRREKHALNNASDKSGKQTTEQLALPISPGFCQFATCNFAVNFSGLNMTSPYRNSARKHIFLVRHLTSKTVVQISRSRGPRPSRSANVRGNFPCPGGPVAPRAHRWPSSS